MTRPIVHPSLGTRLTPSFFDAAVTIQRATAPVSNPRGTASDTYSDLADHVNLPCRKWPAGSSERWDSDKTVSEAQFICLIRGAYAGIRTKDRAVIGGVTYDIAGVEPDSETAFTRLRLEVSSL